MARKTAATTLAIDGGDPVRTDPFPPRGMFDQEEKKTVIEMFDRCIEERKSIGYNGDDETAYCQEFAAFHGGGFVDAVNSGTGALYVALQALEIEPFTEVIVPPFTDPGGVMPVPLLNLIPIPADSAPESFNAGAEQVKARLTDHTSAIVVAHIAGIPAEMNKIVEVARDAGVPLIEDCSQAHGATYNGQHVGTFGDVGVFSTMSGKHHATGAQGGAVLVQDEDLYWRCRRASDRGKPFNLPAGSTNIIAALNLNLNDLSAAIGRVQMKKLPTVVANRRRNALALAEQCQSLKSVGIALGPAQGEASFWFIFARLNVDKVSISLRDFAAAVAAEGIPVGSYCQYLSNTADWFVNRKVFGSSGYPWQCPLYKGDPGARYALPNAEAAAVCHFTIKFHEKCGDQEVADTFAALEKVEAAYLN